jgi:copper chaperone CopZ
MKKRITIAIEGMHCPNCVMKLEAIEDRLPGIARAEASYHKGQMLLEYDESRISEDQIRSEIHRLGFEVKAITLK